MSETAVTDTYRVIASGRDEVHHDRANALRVFQSIVATGVSCEVWDVYGENSGVKIADFPGLR